MTQPREPGCFCKVPCVCRPLPMPEVDPRDQTIADLRELLEFKRAEITRLSRSLATVEQDRAAIVDDIARTAGTAGAGVAVVPDQFGSAPRASIVAFLEREAARFDTAALTFDDRDAPAERCRVKAGFARTLAAQIARGDDRLGGDPDPGDATRFGSAADREAEQ